MTDAELVPLAGALVSISDQGQTTTSAQDGGFAFSQVTPGQYAVYAALLGYESAGKSVNVVAGEVTGVQFSLAPIPIEEPFHQIMSAKGMLGCAVDIQPVVGVAACGLPVVNTTVSDRFLIVWTLGLPTENWDAAVFETHWTSNQVLSQGLNPIWEINACSNDNDVTFAEGGGRNPMIFYVNQSKIEEVIDNAANDKGCGSSEANCNEDDCKIHSRMFSEAETTGQTADVGLTIQQTYENFFSSFFDSTFPEGYSAKTDG